MNAEYLCKQYGFDYCKAVSDASIKKELKTFYKSSESPKLLEIFTPRELTDKILLGYFDFIS